MNDCKGVGGGDREKKERERFNGVIFARESVFKTLSKFQPRPSLVFCACTNNI